MTKVQTFLFHSCYSVLFVSFFVAAFFSFSARHELTELHSKHLAKDLLRGVENLCEKTGLTIQN